MSAPTQARLSEVSGGTEVTCYYYFPVSKAKASKTYTILDYKILKCPNFMILSNKIIH